MSARSAPPGLGCDTRGRPVRPPAEHHIGSTFCGHTRPQVNRPNHSGQLYETFVVPPPALRKTFTHHSPAFSGGQVMAPGRLRNFRSCGHQRHASRFSWIPRGYRPPFGNRVSTLVCRALLRSGAGSSATGGCLGARPTGQTARQAVASARAVVVCCPGAAPGAAQRGACG